jgi:glucose/arabinose dehydrogenase
MPLTRLVWFAGILIAFTLTVLTVHGDKPAEPRPVKPYGIDKRVELTTSRVIGSPEPPPPYRVVRAYTTMKMEFPVFVIHQPGSDRLLLTTETHGYGPTKLQRMKDDPGATELETLYTWEDGVAYSIEFHPDFANNGQVFIGWNGTVPGDKVKKTRITRYHMDPKPPYKFDASSAKEIISVASDGHNGAALAFGKDGMLYVTTGDGTSDSDTNIVGQKMDTLLAKLLRIDVDHPDADKPYSVPKDNPLVGKEGICPETWAYGFRNPWRLTVDKKTGHIWLGQNGQDLWEQAYLVNKGDNAGWSVMEGSHVFYPNRKPGPTPFVKPTVEHPHSEFRSLTGGIVYYGDRYPDLQGAYIYGDYSTGKVWGIKHDGTKVIWHKELASTTLAITSFGTDARGEILITDHRGKGEGGLYRLEPNPRETSTAFPRKLSESGLFRSVKGHIMEPALIPYSVNAQLWSDGAHKERWFGIPGSDPKIDMTAKDGWNFPDKTVAVKSFALEREPGKPETRRWVETRFLTRQDGQWYGYSYVWNDEQTDATLVPKEGMDREYAVGNGKQKWHYPSRTECMVCHSRAANFVLGLSTVQMNKVHDYGGVKDEQLRVLEHLGLVRLSWDEDVKEAVRAALKKEGKSDQDINEYLKKQPAPQLEREAKQSGLLPEVPAKYKKLVDPYDKAQPLEARARSYLHANCAICHVNAGGGNAQFDVDFLAKPEAVKLFDVKPQHHTFGIKDARLIAPGDPERSVLLHRVATRDQGHMPPLATSLVDREATEMLREWVKKMNAGPK